MELKSPPASNGNKVNHNKEEIHRQTDHLDLVYFVSEIERFNRLIDPLSYTLYVLEDVRRWRYPVLSLVLWITFNIGCIILSKGAVFVLVSLLVVTIVTCALIQNHTGLVSKFLPSTQSEEIDLSDEEYGEDGSIRTVKQFRFSVLQMYDFVRTCNDNLSYFYGLLKWDIFIPSLIFHAELCTLLLGLVVFPTRGLCFIVINIFFLANEDIMNVIASHSMLLYSQLTGKPISPSHKKMLKGDSDDICGKVPSSLEQDSDDDDVDACVNENLIDDSVSCQGQEAGRPSGMVARLREMKKKRQHLANESCFKCEISFASLFKRRHYCRHCGNNFCAKCCNQKVPKSMFGATSPAAQTETVLVCNTCFNLLKEGENKQKKS